MNAHDACNVFGAGLGLVGYIPYVRGILRHQVRPHVVTWGLWSCSSGAVALATVSAGDGVPWALVVSAIICLGIAVLGLRHGKRSVTRADGFMLTGCALALLAWGTAKDPLYAVAMITAVDVLAFLPAVRKAWRNPHLEKAQTYMANAVKYVFVLMGLDRLTPAAGLYPAAQIVVFVLFTGLLLWRRRSRYLPAHERAFVRTS